jgi:xanthine/CO dehydrogenase XdhC/CoxF family maturation factor
MDGLPAAVTCIRMADPIAAVATAPTGAAHVVLTHSHALDYRLAEAALQRGDASYVGMIGSATKRARFEAGFLRTGGRREALSRLTCPIGGSDVDDKRPEVIAALTAAELVRSLLRKPEASRGAGAEERAGHDATA